MSVCELPVVRDPGLFGRPSDRGDHPKYRQAAEVEVGPSEERGEGMTLVQFVQSFLGTVPEPYDFIVPVTAAVLLILFIAMTLRFILGAVSGLFYR